MDLSETISSVYTPAVGTRRAWASWPAGSGGDGALWVTSMHKWLPIRKRRKGGREGGGGGGGGGGWRVEEVQYLVLLNLWEGLEDTWRHQLNMFCISEQFLCCWWRREEGRRGGGGHHPVSHPVCSFHQSEFTVWSNLSRSANHKCKKQRLHRVLNHRYFSVFYRKHEGEKVSAVLPFLFSPSADCDAWAFIFFFNAVRKLTAARQRKKKERGAANVKAPAEMLWLNFTTPPASERTIAPNLFFNWRMRRCSRTCAADSWLRWCHSLRRQTHSPDLKLHLHPLWPRGSVDFPIFFFFCGGWWWEDGRGERGADGGEEGGGLGWRLERDREADGILFVPLMWGLSFQQINARVG